MKTYVISNDWLQATVTLTDNQDIALTEATDPEKTNQVILEQLFGGIIIQINQWIADSARSKIKDLDPADAYVALDSIK